jgi:hypothetical protein
VLNLFIVYFGDINFNNFSKEHYQPTTVPFFYNELSVKIHVFFVSRLALIDKFKKINRIEHLEYVNDLLIQLYEFKRDKIRSKRIKNRKNSQVIKDTKHLKTFNPWFAWLHDGIKIMKWVTIFSVAGLTLGFFYFKFFF